jgi:polyphosphate glucokinase
MEQILGIDVGATGIKGGIVDLKKGVIVGDKKKIKTPSPATPENVIQVLEQLISEFSWQGKPLGIGFPAIVKNGTIWTASNIDDSFIGFPLEEELHRRLTAQVSIVNDADAAGIAEMTFGKGKHMKKGLVIMITLGTGIGSALFFDGKLIPNTELGHLLYKKSVFERYASNSAKEKKALSWKLWGSEVNVYLNHLNHLFSPEAILIGGGVSKHFDKYKSYIDVKTFVDTAQLLNDAGIIGAAMSIKHKL